MNRRNQNINNTIRIYKSDILSYNEILIVLCGNSVARLRDDIYSEFLTAEKIDGIFNEHYSLT